MIEPPCSLQPSPIFSAHAPVPAVGIDGVRKDVLALVARGIGVIWRAQERQPHTVVLDVIAVLAVVEQADAVQAFGQIRPLVSTDLKARDVVAGVPVRRALDGAELDLVRRLRREHVRGKRPPSACAGFPASPRA